MTRPARLDLHLLRVVVALMDAGTVSRAATRLGTSQPTVSGALAKLRAHFDDPLFVRSRTGMAPTPRGAEVVAVARDILCQIDERLQPRVRFDPSQAHKPFTFALSDVGEIVFLPKLARALEQQSPETAVRSVTLRPQALARALEEGDVDLAIGYFPDLKKDDFYQQRLFTHHFVCLVRADHPIGPSLTVEEFLSLRHAVVLSEGRSQEILESFLEEHALRRRVAIYTPHFLSIPKLIAMSDMIVTVPHAMGIEYGKAPYKLRVLQTPFPSPRIALRQHWHTKFHKDARSIWLRDIVGRLFNATTDEWGRPKAGD
jgi:DNA-binding transcriptional LysR family regulator